MEINITYYVPMYNGEMFSEFSIAYGSGRKVELKKVTTTDLRKSDLFTNHLDAKEFAEKHGMTVGKISVKVEEDLK